MILTGKLCSNNLPCLIFRQWPRCIWFPSFYSLWIVIIPFAKFSRSGSRSSPFMTFYEEIYSLYCLEKDPKFWLLYIKSTRATCNTTAFLEPLIMELSLLGREAFFGLSGLVLVGVPQHHLQFKQILLWTLLVMSLGLLVLPFILLVAFLRDLLILALNSLFAQNVFWQISTLVFLVWLKSLNPLDSEILPH